MPHYFPGCSKLVFKQTLSTSKKKKEDNNTNNNNNSNNNNYNKKFKKNTKSPLAVLLVHVCL